MPIQAPQWTDYLNCPVCCREFGVPPRSPISLGCGHTLCKHCLKHLHRKQCPFDQTVIHVEPEELVVNTALLQLAGYTPPAQPYHPPCIQALAEPDRQAYDIIVRSMEHLAAYLKFCGNANNSIASSRLSRPMQRKLVTLLQCAMTDEDGRGRAARAARSLGERTVTELILQHQNPQQLSANLWAAVRARGCQFLGPAMQEEVLKLVLLALEDGSALSRKVLVMFVVQRLEPHFPQASKTSIGHVVQLLYRASCFKVSKRESDSSLMQLKEEFRTYDSLRREHDAQIVQIATEAGLRIAPDQWSALLYGDTSHKSHMQSIIDKLQTPQSFAQSVQELFIALQRTGDPAQLVVMSMHLDRLANIDASPDAKSPTWQQLAEIMSSLKEVVSGLVHYLQQQATGRDANHNQKYSVQERSSEPSTSELCQPSPQTAATTPTHTKYKVSMCRDTVTRSFCPRGTTCTFAHSEEELERYRGGPHNNPQGGNNGNFPPGPHHNGPPGPQPLPPNIPMPPQQQIAQVPQQMPQHMMPPMQQQPMPPQQMYPRYPPHGRMHQRPRDNYNGPPMSAIPAVGMPPDVQYNQEYNEYSQPITYSPPIVSNQPPPMGLDQNTMMVPFSDRNCWQYSNIVPYGDEPGNYIYHRQEYARPHYGPNGPGPMPYSPMSIYVPLPHDDRRSSSPQDNGYIDPPLYRFVPRGNIEAAIWQPNNEVAFDLDRLRTSLPQCSSMPAQMFRVTGDRRSVGPERLAVFVDHMAIAGGFDFTSGADDGALVEELQALERRIDTEYESAE